MIDCILQEPLENPNPLAKAELNLLAHLVGGATKKPESELLIGFSRVRVCASSALISWRHLGRVYRPLWPPAGFVAGGLWLNYPAALSPVGVLNLFSSCVVFFVWCSVSLCKVGPHQSIIFNIVDLNKKMVWTYRDWKRSSGWLESWRFDNLCGSHLQSQVVVLVSWKFKNPGERFDWSVDRVAVGKCVMWLAVKTCANRWDVKWIINKVLLFPIE